MTTEWPPDDRGQMTTNQAWEPFERDPAPGDPDRIRAIAGTYSSIADTAHTSVVRLRAISDGGRGNWWRGDAADAFVENIDTELIAQLGRLNRSYGSAADALGSYANALQELKQRAASALQRARIASDEARSSDRRLTDARTALACARTDAARATAEVDRGSREFDSRFRTTPPGADPSLTASERADWEVRARAANEVQRITQDDLQHADRAVARETALGDDARTRVRAAAMDALAIAVDHDQAVRAVVVALDEAADQGVGNRNLLQAAWHGVVGFVEAHIGVFDIIGEIGHLLCQVGGLLSMLPIPVLQQIGWAVTTLGVGASVLSLAASALVAADGKRSWGAVAAQGIDVALDVLPAAGRLARAGTAAAEVVRTADAVSDLGRSGRFVSEVSRSLRAGASAQVAEAGGIIPAVAREALGIGPTGADTLRTLAADVAIGSVQSALRGDELVPTAVGSTGDRLVTSVEDNHVGYQVLETWISTATDVADIGRDLVSTGERPS